MAVQKKTRRKTVSRVEAGIIRGLEQALAFERGDAAKGRLKVITLRDATVRPAPEFTKARVAQLRERLGMSQAVFAQALNVSSETVKAWEQGKNVPGGPAARLLELTEAHPEIVLASLIAP